MPRNFHAIKYFKACHTIKLWKVYLNVFWLVTSPRIEQQQLSINKFSLNLTRYQKIVVAILLYTIPGARYKKKTRTRVGRWLYERYYSKKLILKYQSKYLCCGLQNKIIKNPVSRRTRFHAVEACKNHVSLDNSVKSVVFHHSGLLWWDSQSKWDFVYTIFSIAKAIVL